jgi:hypothetical protein
MRKTILAFALIVAGGLAWRALRSEPAGLELVFDRFWVDHLPRGETDQFNALFLSGESPGGHFAVQTPWEGRWQGFHYHVVPRQKGVLDLFFGPRGGRERVQISARHCREEGFDFCLSITGNSRGVERYYSKNAWRGSAIPAELGGH